jgi:hypothetical protein
MLWSLSVFLDLIYLYIIDVRHEWSRRLTRYKLEIKGLCECYCPPGYFRIWWRLTDMWGNSMRGLQAPTLEGKKKREWTKISKRIPSLNTVGSNQQWDKLCVWLAEHSPFAIAPKQFHSIQSFWEWYSKIAYSMYHVEYNTPIENKMTTTWLQSSCNYWCDSLKMAKRFLSLRWTLKEPLQCSDNLSDTLHICALSRWL